MSFDGVLITEIFHSLQGETSLSGLRFAFIRLTGCNLRCSYCDSAYAFKGGRRMNIDEVLNTIRPFQVRHVLLTGGEPLLQRGTLPLLEALRSERYQVSIETHGEISIEKAARIARIIMDIKTPSSRMCRGGYRNNLAFLKEDDEVKFVIASHDDYFWARELIQSGQIPTREVLLSPAVQAIDSPGQVQSMDATWLAERILEDKIAARLQLQLHKLLWGPERKGV